MKPGKAKYIPCDIAKIMSNLQGLVSELQMKLKERDTKIRNLESMLKAAGIKAGPPTAAADDPAKLQQKIADLDAENQKLRENLANQQNTGTGGPLTELVKDLQTKLKKKDEELAKVKSGGVKGPSAPSDDSQKLANKIAMQDAEILGLQETISTLKGQASKSEQAGPMADLVKDLQRKLKSKDEEIEHLKSSAWEKATGPDKSGDLKQLSSQVNTLSIQSTELKKSVDTLEKQLRQKEQLLLGLQDENKMLKDQSRDGEKASGEPGRLVEENRVLSDKLNKARQQVQYLSDDLARKNQDIMLLQQYRSKDAMEVIQKERDALKDQSAQAEKRLQVMQAKLVNLEKEQEEAGTRQQMLRFRELRSMLDSMKRQIRLQNQELNEIKRKVIV